MMKRTLHGAVAVMQKSVRRLRHQFPESKKIEIKATPDLVVIYAEGDAAASLLSHIIENGSEIVDRHEPTRLRGAQVQADYLRKTGELLQGTLFP